MDIEELKRKLNEIQGASNESLEVPYRPEDQLEPMIEPEIQDIIETAPEVVQEAQIASEIASVNDEIKSPFQQTKPELVENAIEEQKDNTVQGQIEKRVDPDIRQKMLANIENLEKEANAKDEGVSLTDRLPDILAALHNTINYGQGTSLPTLKTDHGDKLAKSRAAGKKDKVNKLQQLQNAYKDYLKSEGGGSEKVYQTRSGLVKLNKDGSTEELYKDPYMVSGGKVREDSLELRKEKLKNSITQKYQDDAEKTIKLTRASDSWKDAEKALSSIPNIELLLEDAYIEGGQSLSMLGPKIAKGIAGEVGVLTEQDVTRYVKNPQLAEGMLDSLSKIKSGKLTEASYENIKRLLEISKQAAQGKMDNAIMRDAQLFAKRENIPLDQAYELFDNNFRKDAEAIDSIKKEKGSKKEIEFSAAQERGIENVMNKNNITRDQAIKALKNAGKL